MLIQLDIHCDGNLVKGSNMFESFWKRRSKKLAVTINLRSVSHIKVFFVVFFFNKVHLSVHESGRNLVCTKLFLPVSILGMGQGLGQKRVLL